MNAQALFEFAGGGISPEVVVELANVRDRVERELEHRVGSPVAMVDNVGRHTLRAGGKRLRPIFVALGAMATGLPYDAERVDRLGACMEMIHMATLIHDDVIDRAETRRGIETAGSRYGSTEAILSGDVLLARAMAILAEDGDLGIIRTVSRSVVEMAEGEVRELEVRNDFDLSEDAHLEVLRMKTASFIAGCCDVGARAAGASATVREALSDYGTHVGMAFQIVDDLLDYRGDPARTGKPIATDFREGCATLPLIYLRSLLSDEEREVARRKFGNGVSDDELRMICGWMEVRGAFELARGLAEAHVRRALAATDPLPEGAIRDLLRTFAEFVLRRDA